MSRTEEEKFARTERLFKDLPLTAPMRVADEYLIDPSDEGFAALIARSKHVATGAFRAKGMLPVTFLLYCTRHPTRVVDQGGVFMTSIRGADDEETFEAQKEAVATFAIPLLVKFGGADAVAYLSEVWVSRRADTDKRPYVRASKDPERQEALYITVQTKHRSGTSLGRINRYGRRGITIDWEDLPSDVEVGGRFSNLMQELPLPAAAEAMLQAAIEEQRRERAAGTT